MILSIMDGVVEGYPGAMGKLRQLMPVLPEKLPQQQEQCEQSAQSNIR